MPTPPPTTVRPVGLVGSLRSYLQAAPSASPSPDAAPSRAIAVDQLQLAPRSLGNARFSAHADLTGVAAGRVLRPGVASAGISAVQRALNDMGFIVPGGANGQYGAQTVQALKNFQAMAGLEADGTLGPKTMRALDHFAPAPGKASWEAGQDPGPVPTPDLGNGKRARVVISLSQHRAFAFDKAGNLTKIYPVRTGRDDHADGRGSRTLPGVRVVTGKNSDPSDVSNRLWPEAGGRAFGNRLIDLTPIDPSTGQRTRNLLDPVTGTLQSAGGQELHGTDQESSLGRDFSHGCVGFRNADIEEIFDGIRNGEFVRVDA